MKKSLPIIMLLLIINAVVYAQSLKVSANGRYLTDRRNKPFLWIGDTAWELFHKLTREEADEYLETRAKQGFTVIQAVIISELDGLRTPNAYGELPFINMSPVKPNEAYFKHVDYIINKAQKLGLYMAILPTWADKAPSDRPGGGPIIFNKENAAAYGTFLAKRYKNKPVIWVLGGDRNVLNDEVFAIWKAMGLALKATAPKQLISYHPAGEMSSSAWFQNEKWIDFNMYQSGHAHRYMPVYKFAKADHAKIPIKPFIDAEPAYEDIPIEFWTYIDFNGPKRVPDSVVDANNLLKNKAHFKKGFFTDYDVRVHAYWNFLAGACGYTYGNNAIWQMFKKDDPFVIPCLADWKTAMNAPGANQMKHVKSLFIRRPFYQLVPDDNLVTGTDNTDSLHIASAIAKNKSFAVIYLAVGRTFEVHTDKIGKQVKAWWFNPKSGKTILIPGNFSAKNKTFTPPTTGAGNDWVLVIDKYYGK